MFPFFLTIVGVIFKSVTDLATQSSSNAGADAPPSNAGRDDLEERREAVISKYGLHPSEAHGRHGQYQRGMEEGPRLVKEAFL